MKKKLSRSKARRDAAFTLIEVLLVLAILLVVAGAVVVNAVGVSDEANRKFAKSQIANLTNSVNLYRLNTGSYPTTLDALYTQPTDIPDPSKWVRVIEKPVPADPWNRPYEYKTTGNSFEIRCLGPDGQSNTQDDITG